MLSASQPAKSSPVVLLAICVALIGPAGARGETDTASLEPPRADMPTPEFGPGMASPDRFAIKDAFRIAVRRVHRVRGCAALFNDLDLDGIEALGRAVYQPAESDRDLTLCRRGASAMTGVGSARIRLCDSFKNLSRFGKARSLLHEALHTAGLSEYPYDSQAPTPRQINDGVSAACSL